MLGKIGQNSIIAVLFLIIGWTACVIFQDFAILSFNMSISTTEVIAIVVDIFLAWYIVSVLEKNAHNSRVEKEFYLKELDDIFSVFSEMEQTCAKQTVLSLDVVVSGLARSKRIFNRFWKLKVEHDRDFLSKWEKQYYKVLACIKIVDASLTDAQSYKDKANVEPIVIRNGKIYINKTVRPLIEEAISTVKKEIFEMKLLINKE